jgi:hypothetical protein
VRQPAPRTPGPSPLQNRVRPDQEIVADPGRGTLMGNRGCLHDENRRLRTARWRSKLWICCALEWQGVRRDVMPPGRWTALFFLDEATALAAGHRPCAYCRNDEYQAYRRAWQKAFGLAELPRAVEMDAQLHPERVDRATRRQRTTQARAADLPGGVMVRHDGRLWLLAGSTLLEWSFGGYGSRRPAPAPGPLEVLTPPSSIAVLAQGYQPLLHPSAVLAARSGPL